MYYTNWRNQDSLKRNPLFFKRENDGSYNLTSEYLFQYNDNDEQSVQ